MEGREESIALAGQRFYRYNTAVNVIYGVRTACVNGACSTRWLYFFGPCPFCIYVNVNVYVCMCMCMCVWKDMNHALQMLCSSRPCSDNSDNNTPFR